MPAAVSWVNIAEGGQDINADCDCGHTIFTNCYDSVHGCVAICFEVLI
jgi:hypothetical protein